MTVALDIRLLHTAEEMSQVESLQQAVWPGADVEIVPAHLLLTAAHNGGLVAGAWAGERLAGFVFSFLGLHETESARCLKHCSHQLGVHPDFRSAGVGYALKTHQREHVLRQGLELITWTYDPLLARNAQLNRVYSQLVRLHQAACFCGCAERCGTSVGMMKARLAGRGWNGGSGSAKA